MICMERKERNIIIKTAGAIQSIDIGIDMENEDRNVELMRKKREVQGQMEEMNVNTQRNGF